jgi:hypothetical protein
MPECTPPNNGLHLRAFVSYVRLFRLPGVVLPHPAAIEYASGTTSMRKMKRPSLRDMVIPLGMFGGACAGLLVATFMNVVGEPAGVRRPGDPGDAPAMLGVFFMLAGATAGTVLGVIVAIASYLKRRREMKYR